MLIFGGQNYRDSGPVFETRCPSLLAIPDRLQWDPLVTYGNWTLQMFQRTFANFHLRNGADVATVSRWLGRSDSETTMAYRKGAMLPANVRRLKWRGRMKRFVE